MSKLAFFSLIFALIFTIFSCDTVQPVKENPEIELMSSVIETADELKLRIDAVHSGSVYMYSCSNLIFHIYKKVHDDWEMFASTLCNGMAGFGYVRIAEAGEVSISNVPIGGAFSPGSYRLVFSTASDKEGSHEIDHDLSFELQPAE